jgi:hypothetical protein
MQLPQETEHYKRAPLVLFAEFQSHLTNLHHDYRLGLEHQHWWVADHLP